MPYGHMTHSWVNSPENHQMKRERADFTKKFEAGEVQFNDREVLMCQCQSFRFSHLVADHKYLRSERDWRTWEQRNRS